MLRRFVSLALAFALAISASGCIFLSQRVQVTKLDTSQTVSVKTPVKAHLKDGSTIVYLNGVEVSGGQLRGAGTRHDLALKQATLVDTIPLDSVVGMEAFTTRVNGGKSAIVSSLATAGAVVGTAALLVAIFGSCPTVYSNDGNVEEAELFSSSIAPLFEGRDIDRLRAQPGPDGTLRLEIRNEAMETHYINHLQLIEVEHAPGEFVLPDQQGHPVVVGDIKPAPRIVSRSGRDLRAILATADDAFYSTDRELIDRATTSDMDDWIDLNATVPDGAETTTLVFRLRNSMLSTTLLYDVMLGPAGAGAIDWLGDGLARIDNAVELGRWHRLRAGLHISIWQDGGYREVARIPDSGPISWHDVAAVIPVPRGESSLRLRISFVADHWRIDRLGIASATREPRLRTLDVASVTGSDGKTDPTALESLQSPDDRYLQTNPGQKFFVDFRVGPHPPLRGTLSQGERDKSAQQSRTLLLSSQGYYTEWIRGKWIQTASTSQPFAPSDASLLTALRKWASSRDSFEQRFRTARVPVN